MILTAVYVLAKVAAFAFVVDTLVTLVRVAPGAIRRCYRDGKEYQSDC